MLRYSILDCFHPSVLPVTLALFVVWPVTTLIYYGLTFRLATVSFSLSLFLPASSFSADKIHLTENTYVR